MLLALIDQVLAENPAIDPTRIYLTGLSMGGFGTFDVLCRRPNLFAAAIAVCSGGDPAVAPKIKDVPLWYFHGARDEVVPVENTRQMVAALKNAGSKVKYTEYATLGHAIWQETYYNPEVLSWLFRQHK
jgi:predicted peptidase